MGPDGPHLLERNPVIRVRPMASDDRARWDAFVAACPEATFFHRAGWREVLERAFGHRTHYLLAERGSDIVGVLPLTEIRSRLFGHALISNAFCVYGGIATTDEAARAALDSEARKLARALQVGYLEYRNLRPRHPDWPTQDLYCTFRKPLEPDVEANLKAIPRKQRAMVRKGMKKRSEGGIRRRCGPLLCPFCRQRAPPWHAGVAPPLFRPAQGGVRCRL
jgi:FemAB-related protein (PEP-CTERM system-associated)